MKQKTVGWFGIAVVFVATASFVLGPLVLLPEEVKPTWQTQHAQKETTEVAVVSDMKAPMPKALVFSKGTLSTQSMEVWEKCRVEIRRRLDERAVPPELQEQLSRTIAAFIGDYNQGLIKEADLVDEVRAAYMSAAVAKDERWLDWMVETGVGVLKEVQGQPPCGAIVSGLY